MSLKEGQSTNRPPLLEGPNYVYWKSRMKTFLKSIDERAWRAVMIGWTEPTMANPEGAVMPKPEALWSEADDVAAVWNSKALNAIFYGVDEKVFKLIAECEVAKEAWDILRIAYEGPDSESNDGSGEKLRGAGGEHLRKHVESVTEEVNPSEKVDDTIAEVSDRAEKDDDLDGIYKVHVSAVTSSQKSSQAQAVGVEHSASALNPEAVKEVSVQADEPGDQQRVETVVASVAVSVEETADVPVIVQDVFHGEKVKADLPNICDTMMEKNRETHPAGLVGLRRRNAELSRKEVHLNLTGNPHYLIKVKPIRKRQFVTCRDGGKGQVIGCGTLKVPDLPELEDILLVDGLKVNLISISRLFDEGQSVTFTCDSCQVLDRNGDTLKEGSRSSNISYLLGTVGTGATTVCPTNTIHEMELQGTGMVSSSGEVKDGVAPNSVLEDKIPEGGPADEATPTLAGTLDNAPALQPSWRIKSRANEIKCRELADCLSSPKNVIKAFIDEIWVVAIHVELEEHIRYKAWKLYQLVHSHELKDTIYGLTQAPRAWYEMFLIDHGYERGGVEKQHMFVTSTQKLVGQFVRRMQKELQLIMGEMKHLPGTHVDQMLGEQESIATWRYYTQFLWMKQNLSEHGVERVKKILPRNPVQHSMSRYHFIRELVEKKVIASKHMTTTTAALTMPLDATQFKTLRSSLGLRVMAD
ncbi:unnamed protein product [Rhodiola kirilowii]